MLSKKRSTLRAKASKLNTTLIIGKGGIDEGIYNQAASIINKREILKGKVLKSSMFDAGEAARDISKNIGAEVICDIGNKFILYKKRQKTAANRTKDPIHGKAKRAKGLSFGKNSLNKHRNLKLKIRAKNKINSTDKSRQERRINN